MDAALAQSRAPSRGADLLLAHCASLDGDQRPAANDRLRALIGTELTSLLVRALAPGRGGRSRDAV